MYTYYRSLPIQILYIFIYIYVYIYIYIYIYIMPDRPAAPRPATPVTHNLPAKTIPSPVILIS